MIARSWLIFIAIGTAVPVTVGLLSINQINVDSAPRPDLRSNHLHTETSLSQDQCSNQMESSQIEIDHSDINKAREHMAALSLVPQCEATNKAERSGSWSNPRTWQGGRVPE